MEAIIWFTGLFCTALGALITHLEYRRKIRKLNKAHEAELFAWFSDGHSKGWEGALQSPLAVRDRYEQLFNRH